MRNSMPVEVKVPHLTIKCELEPAVAMLAVFLRIVMNEILEDGYCERN